MVPKSPPSPPINVGELPSSKPEPAAPESKAAPSRARPELGPRSIRGLSIRGLGKRKSPEPPRRKRSPRRAHRNWPRKLKFTREGKYFLGITLGVGFAAINTGNNLLYLLLGMMLSLIIVSIS